MVQALENSGSRTCGQSQPDERPPAVASSSEELQANIGLTARPSLRSLLVRRTVLPILNYAFLAFVDDAFLILQPLMYSTAISEGGLGFKSLTIGVDTRWPRRRTDRPAATIEGCTRRLSHATHNLLPPTPSHRAKRSILPATRPPRGPMHGYGRT